MPYLSKIKLNPLRVATQKMLRNPQILHAAVLGSSSHQPVTERMLWRLEMDNPYIASLLVLTQSAPSWEHLVEQAGWCGSDEPQALVRPYEPLLEQVALGREFSFRLRANTVTSTKNLDKPSAAQQRRLSEARPRGIRVPHRSAAHQFAWITSKANRWGFDFLSTEEGYPAVTLSARERLSFQKTGQDGKRHTVILNVATFDGRCRIVDPEAARVSLLAGVGPARAYGCGLITLAPIHAGSS